MPISRIKSIFTKIANDHRRRLKDIYPNKYDNELVKMASNIAYTEVQDQLSKKNILGLYLSELKEVRKRYIT